MRWSAFALLLLFGCPSAPVLQAGSPCPTENLGRCEEDTSRLLQCKDGSFTVYADCKGPKGCAVSGDTAECDTSGNSVGDRCAPTSEGKVRCDPDGGTQILRCEQGALTVEMVCPQGRICGLNDAGLTCLE
jgi:hypothetical protein